MKDKDRGEQVSWRIPPDLKAQVDALAEADLRTINAEVVVLLREAIEARRTAKEAAKKGGK